MYVDQINHPRFDQYDTRSLEMGIMGEAPCSVELLKQVQEKMHVKHVIVSMSIMM